MSAFLNRVTLVGNLGLDPERRQFPSGGSVVTLRVATTETHRDGSGERVERTEWHGVSVWPEGLQDVVTKYLRKGAKVLVEGKLRTRRWRDESGADRHSTEVHVTPYDGKVLFLEGPRRDAAGDDGGPEGAAPAGGRAGATAGPADDDVPF